MTALVFDKGKLEPPTMAERTIHHLRMDRCPNCESHTLHGGPRGGAAQNLFCTACGAGWNVAPPRYIMFAQRIK
jgi:hypothetical protein